MYIAIDSISTHSKTFITVRIRMSVLLDRAIFGKEQGPFRSLKQSVPLHHLLHL